MKTILDGAAWGILGSFVYTIWRLNNPGVEMLKELTAFLVLFGYIMAVAWSIVRITKS